MSGHDPFDSPPVGGSLRVIVSVIESMSGHSKWSTIKRQKGAADTKRGKIFTKLANTITIAVREGGNVTDPDGNPRLRIAIDAARANNMPKDNIDRAIQRARGRQGEMVSEVAYEGFGPGGFSVIVAAVTDNKQRTFAEVKNVFDKNGGSLGSSGSVSYQFLKMGCVTVGKDTKSADEIFLVAADTGAEDVEDAGPEVLIYTSPQDLARIRDAVQSEGLTVLSAALTRKPVITVSLTDKDTIQKALTFMEKLSDLDDVQEVYANFDIPTANVADAATS